MSPEAADAAAPKMTGLYGRAQQFLRHLPGCDTQWGRACDCGLAKVEDEMLAAARERAAALPPTSVTFAEIDEQTGAHSMAELADACQRIVNHGEEATADLWGSSLMNTAAGIFRWLARRLACPACQGSGGVGPGGFIEGEWQGEICEACQGTGRAALAVGAPAAPAPRLTPAEQAQLDAHWPWTGSKGTAIDWKNPHDVIALLKARLGVTGTAGQQPE